MMSDDRRVFMGATIMAACACGTSSGAASILSSAGLPGSAALIYILVVGAGALLFASGVRRRRDVWLPAALAIVTFAAAATLAPPRIMRDGYPFTDANLAGFGLYYLMVAFFVWTAVRLYRPADSLPAIVGLSAVGLASGCTCCLTTAATRFLALTGGLQPGWLVSRPVLLAVGMIVASMAVMRTVGLSAVLIMLAGAIVSYPVESAVERLAPSLIVGGANLNFLVRYPFWLAGTGLILFGVSRTLFAPSTGRVRAPGGAPVILPA